MGNRRLCGILAAVVTLGMGAAGARATAPLAVDGKTSWSVAVSANASDTERFAARELARYLGRITGASFKTTERAGRDEGNVIYVATYEHAAAGPMPDNFAPRGRQPDAPAAADSYQIVGAANGIWVTGQTPGATLHAVYVFLDSLGCRFLAPELDHYKGSAEVVPRRANLTAEWFGSSAPALKFRKLYVEEGHSHTAENLKQMAEWMPKAGYNTLVVPTNYQGAGRVRWDNWREAVTPELQRRGITIEVGGHGYQNFLNAEMEGGKLFEQHPEWFGQDAKGQRRREKGWVLCTSNADAVDYLTKNFVAYVKDRPEIQIYDFWPPDGARWCECEKCKALGTPADRQALLVAHLKGEAKKVRPDLRIEVLAYHTSIAPPEHRTLDKDVLLDFCPISQQFDYQINDPAAKTNAGYAEALKAWREKFDGDISIYSYYRKYAWDSLPVVIPHYMRDDLKWYMTLPVQGVSTYAEPGDWFTYELNHYVLARLAWDPKIDVDAEVRRFAEARYGEAAGVAVRAYAALEDVVRRDCSVPNSTRRPMSDLEAGEKRLVDAREEVAKVAESVKDEAVKYNLGRLGLMLDYAIGDLRAVERVAAKDKEGARKQVDELFGMIKANADAGVFLVRDQRLSMPRILTRVGVTGKATATGE